MHAVLNFKKLNTYLDKAIGVKDASNNTVYPYVSEKTGGTDVGHVINYDGQKVIVKAGITLSLLGQALKNHVEGDKDKAQRKVGTFILGNFTRITGIKDKDTIANLKTKILKAFDAFLQTELANNFKEKLNRNEKLTTDDVTQIYLTMTKIDTELKTVIGLPAFADVLSGCHGQYFNNVLQQAQGLPVAKHQLLMSPKASQQSLMQGSHLLEQSQAFDAFLLSHFDLQTKSEAQTNGQWLEACKIKLKESLAFQSLAGLCSGILIRHIMGESADNGPDNMLLTKEGIVNVDVTGFRYPRKTAFKDALGWEETLKANDNETLLERLFDPSVFKNRFISDANLPKESQKPIYEAIVAVLKNAVANRVVSEVEQVRDCLANMNADLVTKSMQEATLDAYNALGDDFQFQDKGLAKLIQFNQSFIADAITVATESQNTLEDECSHNTVAVI